MNPGTRAAGALIAGVLLVVGCGTAQARPTGVYTPVRGPWEPVAMPEPTDAPSGAPGPFYAVHDAPDQRPAVADGTAVRETPAPTRRPTVGMTGATVVSGTASWYDYVQGGAAAGPALRSALGPGWRGTRVRVCADGKCVRVLLSDWCACGGGRVIDLDVRSFARLAPPSAGLVAVTVRR
jgi:hypothetical protein